jgi:hypothetical protein
LPRWFVSALIASRRKPALIASRRCARGLGVLHAVVSLQKLSELDLRGTKVTDVGLKELAKLPNIAKLDLSYTQVTDAGLRDLAKLQNLKELDLRSTQATKHWFELIKRGESVLNGAKVRRMMNRDWPRLSRSLSKKLPN